jgi:hypothetical protein
MEITGNWDPISYGISILVPFLFHFQLHQIFFVHTLQFCINLIKILKFFFFFFFLLHLLICMVLISFYSFISTNNQINKHLWDRALQCIINGKLKDDHLLHYDKMFSEDKSFYEKVKGWKHNQRNQECQGKSPFPRIAYDMCHFCVGL